MKVSQLLRIVGLLVIVLLIGITMMKNDEGKLIEEEIIVSKSEKIEKKNNTIYALGDSLTAGYQLPLEQSYPSQLGDLLSQAGYDDYEVVNGGESGDTSAGLLGRLDRLVAEGGSGDIAIVVIGANDGMQSLSLEQLQTNVTKIIEQLQAREISVILGGMQLPTNLNPNYRDSFAAMYKLLAEEYTTGLIPFFLEGVAADPILNLGDGIHPNASGYTVIASNIFRYLEKNKYLGK